MKDVTNSIIPNEEDLVEGGGLQNLAQMLTQGYAIEAYIMSQATKDGIDQFIAANPDKPAPFRTAPIEVDNSVQSIEVRLKPPVDQNDPDAILEEMKRIGKHLPPEGRSKHDA